VSRAIASSSRRREYLKGHERDQAGTHALLGKALVQRKQRHASARHPLVKQSASRRDRGALKRLQL
jgi:hypothetical protein